MVSSNIVNEIKKEKRNHLFGSQCTRIGRESTLSNLTPKVIAKGLHVISSQLLLDEI